MMWFRTLRWLRYLVATLLVFNAFQGLIFRTKQLDPFDLVRENSKHTSLKQAILFDNIKTESVSFLVKKDSDSDTLIKRKGLLTTRPNAKGTILVCHGYMCSKFDVSFLRTFFTDYNCLIFDFRAHGENSEGQTCTMGKDEVYDIEGAVKYIKNHPLLKNQKLIGYGFSMGASTLIEAQAKKNNFDALILDCPYDNTETIVDRGLEKLKLNIFGSPLDVPGKDTIKKLVFNQYTQPIMKIIFKIAGMDITKINTRFEKVTPGESIKKISVPCLFIHCKNDDKIPTYSVKRIFNHARGFKKLWLTNGRCHCDSFFFNPEKYKGITNIFLKKFFSGKLVNSNEIIEDT